MGFWGRGLRSRLAGGEERAVAPAAALGLARKTSKAEQRNHFIPYRCAREGAGAGWQTVPHREKPGAPGSPRPGLSSRSCDLGQ